VNSRVTSVDAARPGARPARTRLIADFFNRTFHYWALLPGLLLLLMLTVYPTLQLIAMSFSTVAFREGQVLWSFSGLANYRTFVNDHIFLVAVRNTVLFVVVVVAIEMVLGTVLALLVSGLRRFAGLYRTLMMVPILVPAIAIGTVWRLMYNYEFGIFNRVLRFLGLPPQTWVGDPVLAMPSVIVVDIWHWVPFVFLIMLAGVESLPREPIEAARVDGASNWQLLRYVMLPLLRPTLVVTLMFRTIFAFKVFDEVYLLTGGGPGTATEVISLYINRVFFAQFRMGYGAFLSVITMLLTAIFIVSYTVLVKRRSAIE
jgi:multiple sugar transport system permease protein